MKIKHSILACLALALAHTAPAGTLLLQNLTADETAAYALTNQAGTLLSGSLTNNIRAGYFTLSDATVLNLWNAGDLSALNSSFVQFTVSSMQDFQQGYNGLFADIPGVVTSEPYAGKNIYLFISNSSDFTDTSAQFLIYKFNAQFTAEPFNGEVLLGTSPGTLLVGGYNNFQHDYDLGGGSLPAFNTVATVPEPGTWAMVGLGAFVVLWRIRNRREERMA